MSSSVVFAQVFEFLNNGDVSGTYKEVVRVGKDIKMKPEVFEFILEAVFNVPPAIKKTTKKIVPAIMISTGKTVAQKKEEGKKEWCSFRQENGNARRLANSLEKVINEEPQEEADALQKAWERSNQKKIEGSSDVWGQEPTYALQPDVYGLFRCPNSDIWSPQTIGFHFAPCDYGVSAYGSEDSSTDCCLSDPEIWSPKPNEIDLDSNDYLAPFDFSDEFSCDSTDSTYDSLVFNFVHAAVFY